MSRTSAGTRSFTRYWRQVSVTYFQNTGKYEPLESVGHKQKIRLWWPAFFLTLSMTAHASIMDEVTAAIRQASTTTEMEIQASPAAAELKYPTCVTPWQITLPQGQRLLGRLNIKISCTSPQWSAWQPVLVQGWLPVVVATAPLKTGEEIPVEFLELRKMEVTWTNDNYFTRLADVARSMARYRINAGAVVTAGMLEAPQLVHRGDEVIIEADAGELTVRDTGIALENGRRGATVHVRNSHSGKIIEGIASGNRLVRIPF